MQYSLTSAIFNAALPMFLVRTDRKLFVIILFFYIPIDFVISL